MAEKENNGHDILVIGGGIVGSCIAYGLRRLGCRTALLDASPGQLGLDKASRSNMGLIWCQSKFAHLPLYARWAFLSAERYPALVREVEQGSGINVRYRPTGGIIPCLGEEEFARRSGYLDELRAVCGRDYPAGMLSPGELRGMLPRIPFGPEVSGAVWCDKDGYIDPLRLLYAVRKAFTRIGGALHANTPALAVRPDSGGYRVDTPGKSFHAGSIVLAAGLSNRKFCQALGCRAPVYADRGQVLLTERVGDILPIPMLGITRTPGGTIIIGFRHEHVGADTVLDPRVLIREGQWALRVWPDLGKLRILRTWAGLRVMPEDGQAIYDSLPGHPRVFLVTSHSSVTLAPAHADLLTPWIAGRSPLPEAAASFTLNRFAGTAGLPGERAC